MQLHLPDHLVISVSVSSLSVLVQSLPHHDQGHLLVLRQPFAQLCHHLQISQHYHASTVTRFHTWALHTVTAGSFETCPLFIVTELCYLRAGLCSQLPCYYFWPGQCLVTVLLFKTWPMFTVTVLLLQTWPLLTVTVLLFQICPLFTITELCYLRAGHYSWLLCYYFRPGQCLELLCYYFRTGQCLQLLCYYFRPGQC